MQPHSHCSWCGTSFGGQTAWPRQCTSCQRPTYRNPLPVAVVLVPVDGKLVAIRRAIEPRKGQLALPGGFIEWGESWQAAAARELREETGLVVDEAGIRSHDVRSAPDGTLLVFGLAQPLSPAAFEAAHPTSEVSECVLIPGPIEMAFPLHADVVRAYFGAR